MKYILVDDSVIGVGGTALTLEGLVEPVRSDLTQIPTNELTINDIFSNLDKTWVFGNIHSITSHSANIILQALSMVRFFKIEFDYGYCLYRGRIPHQILGGSDCDCTASPKALEYQRIYETIKHRSRGNFYMSQEQLDFHVEDLGLDKSRCWVLSSCFTTSFYPLIESLSRNKKKDYYAIIDGQGGWHSSAKGVAEAIHFAKENSLPYKLLKTSSHTELMELLSECKGLIFHPIIHDTCPRITIEARLLGLELRINNLCQHVKESWWDEDIAGISKYLINRPSFLWSTINNA